MSSVSRYLSAPSIPESRYGEKLGLDHKLESQSRGGGGGGGSNLTVSSINPSYSPLSVSSPARLRPYRPTTPHTNARTLALIICTICYLLMGAAVFDLIESENEEKERRILKEEEQELVMDKYRVSREDRERLQEVYVKLLPYKAGVQWKFTGSLFFALTVITTIGYGHSAPVTWPGRLFCMGYAFLGIPLSLTVYQAVGDRVNNLISKLVIRLMKSFYPRALKPNLKEPKSHHNHQLIVVCCNWFLVLFVLLGGAALFWHYENWTYFNSVYYCFITLTTIGFGDFVALQNENALQSDPFYIAMCVLYIMVSLCVVASALNLLVLKYLTMNTTDEKKAAEAAVIAECYMHKNPYFNSQIAISQQTN